MPLPASPHADTFAGTEPNRILQKVVTAGTNNDDPLQQFLPEVPAEGIITEAVLRDPLAHEFEWEPDLLLDQTYDASPDVAYVPTVSWPLSRHRFRRRFRTRTRLIVRSLRRGVRRTRAVAQSSRDYFAWLIKRTIEIGTSGRRSFTRFIDEMITRGRAAVTFCSAAAVLVRTRLTRWMSTIERITSMVGRHLRAISQSRYELRLLDPLRTLGRSAHRLRAISQSRYELRLPDPLRTLGRSAHRLRAISQSRYELRPLDPLRTLGRSAHRFLSSGPSLGTRIPARVVEVTKAHVRGMNATVVSFSCGTAVGALVMWLIGVQVAMPGKQTAPVVTTASNLGAPASATDVSLPRETAPAPPPVSAPSTVPAVPPRPRAAAPPPVVSRGTTGAELIPFRGTLAVNSGVRGARVFVNGRAVGSTPLVLKDVPVGSRAVRVEAQGYHAWSATVRVIANQQTTVTARLDRVMAK